MKPKETAINGLLKKAIGCICLWLLWIGSSAAAVEAALQADMISNAAYASMASYRGQATGIAGMYLKDRGWQLARVKNEENKYFAVRKRIEGHPVYIVAITGTEGKREFLSNLNYKLTPYRDSLEEQVHHGYYEMAENIAADRFFQHIASQLKSDEDALLVVTGHSLGGAVSILLGRYLIDEGLVRPEQIEVVTFGAPMMGNAAFIARLGDYPIQAYELEYDIIPEFFQSYSHGYTGKLGQTVVWDSHMPDIAYSHQMMRYLDEAKLRQLHAYGQRKQRESTPGQIYTVLPKIKERFTLSSDVLEGYQWGVIEAQETALKEPVYVDTESKTIEEALHRAKELGYEQVYWTELSFFVKRESQVRNYYVIIEKYVYRTTDGHVLHWAQDICQSGEYSLLVSMIDRVETYGSQAEEEK